MSEVSAISNQDHQVITQGNLPHRHTPDTSPKSSPLVKSSGRKELPPHWEKVKSEQHGRYYYWNKETGSTTWKFPEEEAKEFQKMVRSHNYMNVKPTPRKRSSTHSGSSQSSPSPSDSPTKSPTKKTELSSTHNGIVGSQGQRSPDLTPHRQSESRGQSLTDPQSVSPLPKSRASSRSSYVNVEITNTGNPLPREPQTPISPFPTTERPFFDQELRLEQTTPTSPTSLGQTTPLSPTPPLPSRNYSESDVSLSPTPQERGSESETSSTDGVRTVQHTTSSQGHEYAVIDRGFKSQQSGQGDPPSDVTSPPPIPLRAHQRLAQDAQEAGYTEVAERAQQRNRGGYVELDVQQNTDPQLLNQSPRPVAYAIVELDKDREKSEPSRRRSLPVKKVLVPPKPRPYEIPTASMENLVEVGYEEIKDDSEQPAEDGYMEVKKRSFQRTSSQGQIQARRRSHKEPYTVPSPTDRESPSAKRDSPFTERDSPQLSQDSVFDSLPRYDLPSNSSRLQKLNATLPRGNEQLVPGYSRLADLSKEAILLRSGVTLRRYGQLDSVSSFMSRGEDGSESSAGSDQDDGLEPVHKAIKSLETSLGVSADNLSEPPVQLVRAPSGPPTWFKAQRRPHAYERINDSPENGVESTNQVTGKRHMISSSLEMDWDATEFSEAKTGLGRVKELSKARSSSQPNLLRDSDVEFPHLKRPPRVSEEAFKLRKMRLLNHEYEDVEKGEVPSAMGHVGDVNVLTSAIKQSWLEGDKGQSVEEGLPKGWQSMKDEHDKTYYWHVPTGRTQYERPSPQDVKRLSLSVDDKHSVRGSLSEEGGNKKRPSPTFKTTYLGSQDVEESELVQGQCVTVVHSCINKMTAQPHPPDAKEDTVFLQVHNANLRWLDPETSSPTLTQAINKIRVWGIGLDNDRDFGYVARDLKTKKHKCHVFRCERPARAVARALLEAHQKERQERKAKKAAQKKLDVSMTSSSEQSGESMPDPQRPPSSVERRAPSHSLSPGQSDYGERITCLYLGSCDVFQQQGIDVVNDAVGRLCVENKGNCVSVNVDVAPSSIKISNAQDDSPIAEHRVRFLCFLGIAKDDRYCGYILDNGMKGNVKQLRFHGFCKQPNTDGLCLALHRACQARYQRVLESNPDAKRETERQPAVKETSPPAKSKSTPNLFERLGSLRKSKNSKPLVEDDSKLQSFVVQYLGCQGVSKAEGLDAVRVPLQQMAQPKSPSRTVPPFLVDFDVTPGGICMTDPHKKVFNRKTFSAKNITYAVRVRNYFAFITKDGGKLNCHVFLENEVDAGTIVSTIEKMLAPESLLK